MEKLAAQYADQGVIVLAINTGESQRSYQKFVADGQYTHLRLGRDGADEISKRYRVRTIPVTYVLDREGIIRYAQTGYGDWMERTLSQEIESWLE